MKKKSGTNTYYPENVSFQQLIEALRDDSPLGHRVAVRHEDLEEALDWLFIAVEEANPTKIREAQANLIKAYERRNGDLACFGD
jgi:hypothetical protein